MGVSISTNPRASRYSRISCVTSVPQAQRPRSSRGGAGRGSGTARRSISSASVRSSIGNGGVSARPAPRGRSAATSTSPVASAGFGMPSGRARTVPVTRDDVLRRAASWAAACASGASSGWNTTCTTPSRSRRSMKVTPPWSRRCATHPHSVTSLAGVVGAQLAAGVACASWSRMRRHPSSDPPVVESGEPVEHRAGGHGLLIAVGQAAQRDGAVRELLLADDRDERAPARSAIFNCAFSGRSSNARLGRHARGARAPPRARRPAARAASPIVTTKHRAARSVGGASPSSSIASSTRSRPMPNPTRAWRGPPSASASPS